MMNPRSPTTRLSLMACLQNAPNNEAWSEFVAIYQPVLLRIMRGAGLQDCDAQDVCQQILQAMANDIEQWRPDGKCGSFRRWLFRVARNRVLKFLQAERKRPRGVGGTTAQLALAQQVADDESLSDVFEREYREQLVVRAAENIHGEFHEATWEAFWRTCVDGQPIAQAAEDLGMSTGAVYVARSRIMARLKTEVRAILDEP